ncbi:MAG: hypothetical protein GY888_13940 [Planctomycetaceae bacterium]|nr:hypothetical protein [Planctomycetaceae bacterium]
MIQLRGGFINRGMGDRSVTRQTAYQLLLAMIVLPMTGCAMCAGPFDRQYSAEGGAWERHDPNHGRVGSAFSDAGAPRDETAVLEGIPDEGEATDEVYYEASPELGDPLLR